jgi:glycosyltransferase involved in cell wall biosynthesis
VNLLIIADAFPPMRTSAAVHMHELVLELVERGDKVTVIIPVVTDGAYLTIEDRNGYTLVLVATPKTKDVGYIRRAIAEFVAPYIMYHHLRSSLIIDKSFEGIIWYSPTIFFGPLISRFKVKYGCPAYLVLRDMFPEWAVDLGLMKKGLPYYFLKLVELYQYKVASYIGIQAPGNFKYFNTGTLKKFESKVELLWTWVTPAPLPVSCSIDLSKTELAGRLNFIYAGNMGIAQDFDLIMDLATLFNERSDIGFVFVGRGTEVARLKAVTGQRALKNILFFDEIESAEIPALYAQCSIGLVALDPRHKSNNIPGKFLSYMDSGLPVLARLNIGNDLFEIIRDNQVGVSYVGSDAGEFQVAANRLIELVRSDSDMPSRCKNLAHTLFSTQKAAKQIVNALEHGNYAFP